MVFSHYIFALIADEICKNIEINDFFSLKFCRNTILYYNIRSLHQKDFLQYHK